MLPVLFLTGTAILMDYRLRHRGLGNSSKAARPLLYMTYAQPHYKDTFNFSLKRYRKMPELIKR